jgi:hypothetical protein
MAAATSLPNEQTRWLHPRSTSRSIIPSLEPDEATNPPLGSRNDGSAVDYEMWNPV